MRATAYLGRKTCFFLLETSFDRSAHQVPFSFGSLK